LIGLDTPFFFFVPTGKNSHSTADFFMVVGRPRNPSPAKTHICDHLRDILNVISETSYLARVLLNEELLAEPASIQEEDQQYEPF